MTLMIFRRIGNGQDSALTQSIVGDERAKECGVTRYPSIREP